jgi:hypothetical protein
VATNAIGFAGFRIVSGHIFRRSPRTWGMPPFELH